MGWGQYQESSAAAPELGSACLAKDPTLRLAGKFPAASHLTLAESKAGGLCIAGAQEPVYTY